MPKKNTDQCSIETYIYTYSTNITSDAQATDVLSEARHLFGTLGIALEDFKEMKLINNIDLNCWELYIVTDTITATSMPDMEYEA